MPYASWYEGDRVERRPLEPGSLAGRDPAACAIAAPKDPSVSRQHAIFNLLDGQWWLQDLGSRNGTLVNGSPLAAPEGVPLKDGDRLQFGDWKLQFTLGFPGLDGVNFLEGVGDLFAELRPDPADAPVVLRGLELLQSSTSALLKEGESKAMVRGILREAMKLLSADRGFVVMVAPDRSWHSLHRVGDVDDQVGLSHTVLNYVLQHGTALLSNAPMADPRFGGESLVELHRGALLCAPMELDNKVLGILYLDRCEADRPFARFDLALFQAFVRQASLTLRHAQLAQQALGQAAAKGELLRLRSLHERTAARSAEVFSAMQSALRWLQGYGERASGELGTVLKLQVERLQQLMDAGLQEALLDTPREASLATDLQSLQASVEPRWRELLGVRGAALELAPVPPESLWITGSLGAPALTGLVEPLLMGIGEGATVTGTWQREAGRWQLRLVFPPGLRAPVPDPWTARCLRESGMEWRWAEQRLTVAFPPGIENTPEQPAAGPLLGLVTEEYELMGLFESVAEAGDLAIHPLEAEPPRTALPRFHYLVIDALSVPDAVACVQAFRRHPAFLNVPILVVRAREEQLPELLAAGATDWLPEGFRWEALHHRLQVLKGHDELQRRALAAERLDSFRQMAGTLKHEINNPLAVISMQSELLQRKYPEEPKLAKIDEMVGRIRDLLQVLQKMREAPTEAYPGGADILKLN